MFTIPQNQSQKLGVGFMAETKLTVEKPRDLPRLDKMAATVGSHRLSGADGDALE
jgi:hypothetical protein